MKKWILPKIDDKQVKNLHEKYNLPYFISAIFVSRGFTEENKNVCDILCLSEPFSDPFEIKDMDKACYRINQAIQNHEKICIYGDYDADGVCSISMLYMYLNEKSADVSFYAPDRELDGYGISKKALDKFEENDIKLVITVDNGIASFEEVEYANDMGIDIVIVDHHRQQGGSVPKAYAVVDPHQLMCKSKFKDYCAAGLALKLIIAMENKNDLTNRMVDKYIAIAAIGTIGDAVPALGENRKIIALGVKHIKKSKDDIMQILFEMCGIRTNKVTATDIAFSVVPRINASGRMSSAEKSVKMLTCNDAKQLRDLAEQVNNDNQLRREVQANILNCVKQKIRENPSLVFDRVIVIDGENWHKGVIGIVASKIAEIYDKPCIIISSCNGIGTASGRSIEGFSLHDAIYNCKDYFIKFGGHHMAVGFSIKSDKITDFRKTINSYAKEIADEMPHNCLNIDCELKLNNLNISIIDELSDMQPFGKSFKEPIVVLSAVRIEKIVALKNGEYLKLIVSQNLRVTEVLCFSCGVKNFPFNLHDKVDIVVSINKNEYNSIISLSLVLKDIRLYGINYDFVLSQHRKYEAFKRGDNFILDSDLLPNRRDFIEVYTLIKSKKSVDIDMISIFHLLGARIDYFKICVIIDILCEMSLIKREDNSIRILDTNKREKIDLFTSEIYKELVSHTL